PFSSFTLNVALGRFSNTSPCIWMTSSLDIALPRSYTALAARRTEALETRLLQQALVLVRHDVSLYLRHEIHGHHDDDQQRRAAEVERHVPLQHQELRQQADQ